MKKGINAKVKKIYNKLKRFVQNYFLALIMVVCIGMFVLKVWKPSLWTYKDVIEALKVSVTTMVSMIGFSVTIYVFLNTTLQGRKSQNSTEKEVVILFQKKKQKELGKRLIFSIIVVFVQCSIIALQTLIDTWWLNQTILKEKYLGLFIVFLCLIVTLTNICWLGKFTYEIINYEDGLKRLAINERIKKGKEDYHDIISKDAFLNVVNNMEIIIDRLLQNHMHAKTSNAYDSGLKRAICDGIMDVGDLVTREKLADDYKVIIEYKNLLLQDEQLKNNDKVCMGDLVKSIMNRLFQNYLKNELLTGVNISNLSISNADLSKVSFSNSSFWNIDFKGYTTLYSTDFSNSTLNNIKFEEANCENANFSDSKLIDVQFDTKIKLQQSVFINADLSSMKVLGPRDKQGNPINFDYANFDYANLTNLDIYNVCFDFSRMRNARFVQSLIGKSDLKECNTTFKYADMTKSNLLKCDIKRCNFQNANLNEAVFTHTILENSNLSECKLSEANFTESHIAKCRFDKSYCRNISLKEADISESSFTYTTLNLADLSGAKLSSVQFSDSVCRESLWVRTSIKDSIFTRCVFSGARIAGENPNRTLIKNCDFSFANFTDTAITNIEFNNCNFYGADFSSSRLINIRFVECKNLDTALTVSVWLADLSYYGSNTVKLKEPEDGWRYYK